MVNRISYCKNCEKKSIKSIYYRHENRSFRVAFSTCESCGHFFNFIDWKTKGRIMPYFNDMMGLLWCRLVKERKREWVNEMKKDSNIPCLEGKNHEFTKLFVKNESQTPKYIGYLCKECRTAYFVKTKFLKFHPYDENGTLGGFGVSSGYEVEQDRIEKKLVLTKKDAKKLEKFMKKSGITPL